MLVAIENTGASATGGGADPLGDPNNVLDYTFDTTYSSAQSIVVFDVSITPSSSNETYVGIAGHNLGTLGCSVTIINRGNTDVIYNVPANDDRPIMLTIPARSGAGSILVRITKQSPTDVATISHIAIGKTTDFTSTSSHGQVINKDYQAGFGLAAMHVARKSRTTLNDRAAPTGTLIKTISTGLTLRLDNVARNFAQNELLTYQKFWVENAFFIQFDDDITQTIMAMNFIPAAPKAHNQTRELVNLSYKFQAYNGH